MALIFERASRELAMLQAAVNRELGGAAFVNLFTRVENAGGEEHRVWCVLIQVGTRRWTRESDLPLGEQDKDEIVRITREILARPQDIAHRYKAFDLI